MQSINKMLLIPCLELRDVVPPFYCFVRDVELSESQMNVTGKQRKERCLLWGDKGGSRNT